MSNSPGLSLASEARTGLALPVLSGFGIDEIADKGSGRRWISLSGRKGGDRPQIMLAFTI